MTTIHCHTAVTTPNQLNRVLKCLRQQTHQDIAVHIHTASDGYQLHQIEAILSASDLPNKHLHIGQAPVAADTITANFDADTYYHPTRLAAHLDLMARTGIRSQRAAAMLTIQPTLGTIIGDRRTDFGIPTIPPTVVDLEPALFLAKVGVPTTKPFNHQLAAGTLWLAGIRHRLGGIIPVGLEISITHRTPAQPTIIYHRSVQPPMAPSAPMLLLSNSDYDNTEFIYWLKDQLPVAQYTTVAEANQIIQQHLARASTIILLNCQGRANAGFTILADYAQQAGLAAPQLDTWPSQWSSTNCHTIECVDPVCLAISTNTWQQLGVLDQQLSMDNALLDYCQRHWLAGGHCAIAPVHLEITKRALPNTDQLLAKHGWYFTSTAPEEPS